MRLRLLIIEFSFFLTAACGELGDYEPMTPKTIDSNSEDTLMCSYQKYMSLRPAGRYAAQGSTCYGDYFIQGYNYNDCITIYNLKEKVCLATIEIPAPVPSSKTHVNTVNFGNQKYDEDDYFPLLYISSGYPTNGISYIYVYRLLKEGEFIFSISLVQTISLIDFGGWTEGVVDAENNRLWIKNEKNGLYGYSLHPTPSVFDGNVNIYYEDYLKEFKLDRVPVGSRNQGHLYKDGKILLVTGVPSTNETIAFISIDTQKEERDIIIDLTEVGLVNPENPRDSTFEPEGVIIYNGQLMICYSNAIYTFNIECIDATADNLGSSKLQNMDYKSEYDIRGIECSGMKGKIIIRKMPNGAIQKYLQ